MHIMKIKATGEVAGKTTRYDQKHQVGVSKKVAVGLAGMYPMPRMGEEICVAFPGLMLANISGTYFLQHTYLPISTWPEFFRIEIVGNEPVAGGQQ